MAQHEQLFLGGCDKDSDVSLQKVNTYRDALNMRLISNDGNTFSIETIKGNKKILIPAISINGTLNANYQIIGWTTAIDKIVVFSTNGPSDPATPTNPDGTYADGNGEIGVLIVNDDNTAGYTTLYNHKDLKFSTSFQIEARLFEENSKIERVYWVEKHNSPRALNIANPSLRNYQAAATVNASITGTEYMVLRGTVTQSGIHAGVFGPNQTAGTVFMSDGTAVYSPFVGPTIARVILYSPTVDTIDITPDKELGNIRYDGNQTDGGSLLAGTYQYAYQLITSDGAMSSWSYVTVPTELVASLPGTHIHNYQTYQGTASTTVTTKSINVLIEGIDTNFSRIRVASIHGTSLTATDLPVIFFDGAITGETMLVTQRGGENLGILTADDLKQILVSFKTVGTLDINKNRLFFGNVETSSLEFTFAPGSATLRTIEYLFPSDRTGRPQNIDYSIDGINGNEARSAAHNPTIFTDQWYRVSGGNITYNGIQYGPNPPATQDYFVGKTTIHSWSSADAGAILTPIIKIQKYTGHYDFIPFQDDWTDMKGMAISTFIKSYWRGEKYRFGLLIWDKQGNPTFVRWLNDHEFPQQYDVNDPDSGLPLDFAEGTGGDNTAHDARLADNYTGDADDGLWSCSLRSIGINVSGLDLNQIATSLGVPLADLDQYIDGFSVVRAKRDGQIYAQGIMYQTLPDGTNIRPVSHGFNTLNQHGDFTQPNTYAVYSPEFEFGWMGQPNIASSDVIKTVTYRTVVSGDSERLETATDHYYEKFYDTSTVIPPSGRPIGSDNTLQDGKGATIQVGATGGYGDGSFVFLNRNHTITDQPFVGAKTQIIMTDINDNFSPSGSSSNIKPIVNFIRPNASPYGGTSDAAKANTQYIYCGHYQEMDAAFMAELIRSGRDKASGIINDIEVFGGDCFVNIFDIARTIYELDSTGQFSLGTLFPVESQMNIALREGRHLSRDGSLSGSNPNGVSFDPSQPEEFVYNGVYSYEETNVLYAALPIDFIQNEKFGYRVYYSNQKVNGEFFDSFKIFLTNNFIDVEGWAGDITNLRVKDGRLFYWQNHAFGYIPVNERITLSGGALGAPTTIGEGGVATRYDELKKYYGNQHQWGLGETEDSFVWFDMRRRAFCHATTSGGVVELSTIKGLMSFFANEVHGNIVTHDNPVNKKGITTAYDSRFKEVLMVFKGITPIGGGTDTHFTVGFNNLYKYFSGFYSFVPGNMLEYNNKLLSSFEGFQPAIVGSHAYIVGDVVTQTDRNYVNILAYTSAGSPVQPATDTTHWAESSNSIQVYMHNINDIGVFYGIVRDCSLTGVLNMNRNIPKDFDNHVFLGCDNGNFFTSYEALNSFQTASDLAIVVSNQGEYQFYNRAVYSTLPQDPSTGRLVDQWLQFKLTKDNKLNGNILISSNQFIKLVSLKTTFRPAI